MTEPTEPEEVVTAAASLARDHGREDLLERLEIARRRAEASTLRVLVVGEYKQGKSSLINAILAAAVCPVADDIATSVPTIVRYAEEPSATVYLEPTEPAGSGAAGAAGDHERRDAPIGALEAIEISPYDLPKYVTEDGEVAMARRVRAAVVGIPRQLLQGGLELGDTPGVGGLGSAHTAVTMGALGYADAIVFVSDASQEFTAPELAFLGRARELCPTIICVLTKTDLYPEWRRIAALDAAHLEAAGIEAGLLPVSSTVREVAVASRDADLNEESGLPALLGWLRQLGVDADAVSRRALVNDVTAVCRQLEAPLRAARAVADDPEQAATLLAELQLARTQADELRRSSAGWQQTLGDGVADISSDADHDLRARLRQVLQESSDVLSAADPGSIWGEFEPWLTRRAAAEAAESYAALAGAARRLVQRVTEEFLADGRDHAEGDGADGIHLEIEAPASLLTSLQVRAEPRIAAASKAEAGLVALRGAYGSVLMLGMLGRMVGLAAVIANPLTIAGTLLLGGKAIKDHRSRELAGRRQQANQTVRQYVDEVSFQVGKDLRDTLRLLQRDLRDAFTTRADELHRSATVALAAAEQAVDADTGTRQRRITGIDVHLGRIAEVRRSAEALAPDVVVSPVGATVGAAS